VRDIGSALYCRSLYCSPSRLFCLLDEVHAEIHASALVLQREHLVSACAPDPISLGPQRTLHGL
jgi:hypothetical protein